MNVNPLITKSRQKSFNLNSEAGRKSSMPFSEDERPIKTNSRIIKDEKYRKDMYLAFVRNALIQKAMVSPSSDLLVHTLSGLRAIMNRLKSWSAN